LPVQSCRGVAINDQWYFAHTLPVSNAVTVQNLFCSVPPMYDRQITDGVTPPGEWRYTPANDALPRRSLTWSTSVSQIHTGHNRFAVEQLTYGNRYFGFRSSNTSSVLWRATVRFLFVRVRHYNAYYIITTERRRRVKKPVLMTNMICLDRNDCKVSKYSFVNTNNDYYC